MPLTGLSSATCRGEEVSKAQTDMTGPEGHGSARPSFSFADSPEVLRKAGDLAQPATLEDHFDSGKSSAWSTKLQR